MKLPDFTVDRYREALRQKAAAVLILLPSNITSIPQDNIQVSWAGDRVRKIKRSFDRPSGVIFRPFNVTWRSRGPRSGPSQVAVCGAMDGAGAPLYSRDVPPLSGQPNWVFVFEGEMTLRATMNPEDRWALRNRSRYSPFYMTLSIKATGRGPWLIHWKPQFKRRNGIRDKVPAECPQRYGSVSPTWWSKVLANWLLWLL